MLKLQPMSLVLPQESILGTGLGGANPPVRQKVLFSLAGSGAVSCGWPRYFWDAFWVHALSELLMSSEILLVEMQWASPALILFSSGEMALKSGLEHQPRAGVEWHQQPCVCPSPWATWRVSHPSSRCPKDTRGWIRRVQRLQCVGAASIAVREPGPQELTLWC